MASLQKHEKLKLLFFFLCFFFLQFSSSAFDPSDKYFIDCGSSATTFFQGENRNFTGDSNSKFLTSSSSIAVQHPNPESVSPSLYRTARIFTKSSSYKFELKSNGTHLVRLHFFPFSANGYNLSSAVFGVSASGFQLLSDFSVQNTSSTNPKEFFLKADSKQLEVSFTPSSKSPSSFAFVNAIEVFSAPDNLIPGTAKTLSGSSENVHVLERVFRINVGGPKITPSNDTLWRTWIPDEEFLALRAAAENSTYSGNLDYNEGVTREIAPDAVYDTAQKMKKDGTSMSQNFNITWRFPVNSPNKHHLVRLHFCDIVSKAPNEFRFHVYIGSSFAIKDLDPSTLKYQALAAPFYADFVVEPDNSGNISVSVGPSTKITLKDQNAFLNGVEIMEMDSLASNSHPHRGKKFKVWIIGLILGSFALICVALVICFLVFNCRKRTKAQPKLGDIWSPLSVFGESTYSKTTERNRAPLNPCLNLGLTISFAEIQWATNNFNTNLLIGSGGFGNVYKGALRDGTKIAVKRGKTGSSQGEHEFLAEISVFSKIRHRHLVSLIGYCEEQSEMILVYEFMENGPLRDHLYGTDLPCLSWKQRLEICIGSARGIHYLHTGTTQQIIHRDVKSTNILLDENFQAKVADFGLSRAVPSPDHSHVSTNVKGSFGYLDPEYFKRHHLTQKSDVYSFGVVLLEVLCARSVIDISLPRDQVNLAEWAMKRQKKGELMQIIDPKLVGAINPNSLRKFGETVEQCLSEYGVDRPNISDVLWNLEYALRLQETGMDRQPFEDSVASTVESPLPIVRRLPSSFKAERDYLGTSSEGSSEANSSIVFSQLINSDGR